MYGHHDEEQGRNKKGATKECCFSNCVFCSTPTAIPLSKYNNIQTLSINVDTQGYSYGGNDNNSFRRLRNALDVKAHRAGAYRERERETEGVTKLIHQYEEFSEQCKKKGK